MRAHFTNYIHLPLNFKSFDSKTNNDKDREDFHVPFLAYLFLVMTRDPLYLKVQVSFNETYRRTLGSHMPLLETLWF